MKVLSIIPARGGSKGIPLKNTMQIGGKPLIAWSIQASQGSKYVNRTIVSTDSPKIKEISIAYGAEVIDRPESLSTDNASSESALIHVLENLEKAESYLPDLVVFLQCTSPLTTSEDIDNCIEELLSQEADSSFTAIDYHYFIWKKTDSNFEGINHDKTTRPRRQDREIQYQENGAVYVMKTDGLVKYKHRFFGKIVASLMPESRSFEIDESIHLQIADVLIRNQNIQRKQILLPEKIDAVVLDFDGVLTDNKVIQSETGSESVICDRSDGMGISLLKRHGIRVAVLSTEENPVVKKRCEKLDIECFHNLGFSKKDKFEEYCSYKNIDIQNVIYVGNDINDLECLQLAGCAIVPADAHMCVCSYADIILENKGGHGAVRELCDMILNL